MYKVGNDSNDNLTGSINDDILDGKKGNDSLYGGRGNDTYIYNLGDGKDRITDNDPTADNVDTIKFGAGITEENIKVSKSGNDLVIKLGNSTDEIKVVNFFLESRYEIEKIEFADGITWNRGRIIQEAYYSNNADQGEDIGDKTVAIGTPGDDNIVPNNQNGENFIDPLAGNDKMNGGKGNDTYIFGVGYGTDVIEDYDDTPNNVDTIKFIKGLARQDLIFSKVGDDLKITIKNSEGKESNDSVTVSHFFNPNHYYEIEKLQFGDGTVIEGIKQFRKELEDEFARAISVKSTYDPVIVDLDGNGIEISPLKDGVNFDLDNNGFAEKIQWVNNADGVLARDLNGNGKIDNGSEVFGDRVVMSNGKFSHNGYEALRDLDVNNDYVLDDKDAAFKTLKMWIDKNSDGITDKGELYTLAQLGIEALNLNKEIIDDSNPGVIKQKIGNYENADGEKMDMSQFFFNVDLSDTIDYQELPGVDDKVNSIVRLLPEISTTGNVYGLRKSMMTNEELRNLVVEFTSNKEFNKQELLDKILYSWTGTGNIDWWRGHMDARDLAVVEKFVGRKYIGSKDPIVVEEAAIPLRRCLVIIKDYIFRNLAAQSYLKEYVTSIECNFNEATMKMEFNFDNFKQLCISKIKDNNLGFLLSDLLACYASDPEGQQGIRSVLEELKPLNEEVYKIATANRIFGRGYTENNFGDSWISPNHLPALVGTDKVDYIYGGNGDEPIYAGAGDDHVDGEEGTDTLYGQDGNDEILGGDGIDSLFGGNGNDSLDGGNGNDSLYGEEGNDTIQGGTGVDNLLGGNGNDNLDGGLGNDTLDGNAGNDVYVFGIGSGKDTINNYDETSAYTDIIKLKDGITLKDVKATRVNNNDLEILIVASGDTVTIKDYFISDFYKVDRIEFADGTSLDNETLRNLPLYGTEDGETLIGSPNKESIFGFGGNDTIYGQAGEDTIYGGKGNDNIYGGNNNDIIDGEEGDDYLDGGEGNDTYIFRIGSGKDIINECDATSGNIDTLKFEEGISQSSLDFRRENRNLIITIDGIEDRVFIRNYFLPESKIEKIEFADGSVLDNEILSKLIIYGTIDGDEINSDNVDEVIKALEGADIINSFGGTDKINGGSGNDVIDAGAGDDVVYGDEGNDNIKGQEGNDLIYGNSGVDDLYGGIGNDTLDGGEDNDTLSGGEGEDIYIFRSGSGVDTINDKGNTVGNIDILKFETGITAENISLRRVNRDLVITIKNTTDQVKIVNQFLPNVKIERIEFADGSVLDNAELDKLPIFGTEGIDVINTDDVGEVIDALEGADTINSMGGDDYINGREGDDVIKSGNGKDQVFGDEGNDFIYGGAGNDELDGGSGNDNIFGEAGVDTLKGGLGDDTFEGGEDADIIYGEDGVDTIYGQQGNDTIDGGAGNDILLGGVGDDTYIFNIGSGIDTITDIDDTVNNIDTVKLGEGITDKNIKYIRDLNNNLQISIEGTDDKFIIKNYYVNDANKVEKIEFANGQTIDNSILRELPIYGTENADIINATDNKEDIFGYGGDDQINSFDGEDTIYGGNGIDTINAGKGNDELYGEDGNDTLNGLEGNDRLDGGLGVDSLNGGLGNDTYIFGIGYGKDTILDIDASEDNIDTIILSEGISVENLELKRVLNNLELSIKGTEDKLIITNYYFSDSYKIENIKFANGELYDNEKIKTLDIYGTEIVDEINTTDESEVIKALAGSDSINSYGGNDTIFAGLGNDTIIAGDGNDVLYGEEGNDTLNGGAGSDTYVFSLGSGVDTINNYDTSSNNIDTIKLLEGITEDKLIIKRILNDLVITIDGTTDKITVKNNFLANNGIEKIELANGVIFDSEAINKLDINGTENDDIIKGESSPETILGLAGKDQLYGNGGIDKLYGGEGNDTLYGGVDNDELYGQSDDDTLDGGEGNDTLDGDIGSDTYIFTIGSGQDIITDYDLNANNSDTIKLGQGITEENIVVSRVNKDLVITITGTTDKLTIKNYFLEGYKIESIKFFDDKILTINDNLSIYGTEGDDTFQGDSINETYIGLGGNDSIYGNQGKDNLHGNAGNDSIYGGDGIDNLYGDEGIDTLDGGAGDDNLYGGVGNDTYVFGLGYGEDIINDFDTEEGNIDTLRFGEGIKEEDIIFNRSDYDLEITIEGQNDKLTIVGYYKNDGYRIEKFELFDGTVIGSEKPDSIILYGTDGPDIVKGGDVSDIIMALAEDDTVYGEGGNDIIDGGAGNDTLYGGVGNDTYIFQIGSGKDTIIEDDKTIGNIDVVKFGAGITSQNLEFSRVDNNLEVTILGTSDKLVIKDYFKNENNKIEKFVLDNDTVISSDKYDTLALYGTSGDDVLEAGDCKDTVMALEGGDVIYGLGGDDTINAAGGKDTLYGGTGSDVLNGEEGDDILNGQVGNDTLTGGNGNDIYQFEIGSGTDTINNYSDAASDIDTIEFGDRISKDKLSFTRIGNDLQIIILGTNDRLNIKNYYLSDSYKINAMKFKDGTVWGEKEIAAQIESRPTIIGKPGTSNGDIILGDIGADNLFGNGGDDILYGGAGDDKINGGDGKDELNGEEGNDSLYGGTGNDTYVFRKGFGQDTITDYDATRGNIDTISFVDGITKDDIELVRTNTTLEIRIKGSEDRITVSQHYSTNGNNRIERIIFEDGSEITDFISNVTFYGTINDDTLDGDSNKNIIKALEGADTVNGGANDDEIYGGSDGDFLNGQTGNDYIYGESGVDQLYGEEGNDYLYGGEDEDFLYGGDDNDFLYGGEGNDGLDGGNGNDTLSGDGGDDNLSDSSGSDTYVFDKGYGKDTITDYDEIEGNTDTIKFGESINKADISYKRILSNLEITFGNDADKLTIADYYVNTNKVEVIQFADNSILDNQILSSLDINGTKEKDTIEGDSQNNVIYGFEGIDELKGNAGNDTLYGGDGNDALYGGDGNDKLYGEAGDDVLEGGAGDDTYVFGINCGVDVISSSTGADTGTDKLLISDVNYSDIAISKVNSDLLIEVKGTTDSITVLGYFNGGDYAIEEIQFKGGETLTFEDLNLGNVVFDKIIEESYPPEKHITNYDTTLEKSIELIGEVTDAGMTNVSSQIEPKIGTDILFNLNS
ncbi:calcium-binding protein [Clostridium cellulovorans]|uniref:Calcium binding hemolysin protein, putative n=1 Tax=Clostridium cellulovorans (strain ATCC 35296 / DSM 3052 / OCM 3 / 743B) TaxID=573061 RepID=D9SS98_CLOC7|nr:calcium-binding protein [Clostridium cellulovorans]ADL52545.1 calcium binding hemolysin protein, putative [Clostridium cellulovorans 743B]